MSNRTLFSLLFLLGLAVSGIALFNPYYFDDYLILHDNAWLLEARPFRWFLSPFFDSNLIFTGYRPTLMATFWANVQLFGESPASFRWINILLHTTNALLVVELVRRLRRIKKIDFFAWSVGALFLLHPLQTLGVNFLWKRSSVLEATFLLIAMILHVRERMRGIGYRRSIIAVQIGIFFLALTTKESAIILPLLLLAIDAIFFGLRRSVVNPKEGAIYFPLIIESFAFLWFRLGYVERQTALRVVTFPDSHAALFEHFDWTTLEVIKKYVTLWVAPEPRLFEDPSPLSQFPWGAAIVVAGLLLLTLVSLAYRKEKPFLPFCALLFWIGLAPTTGRREILFVMDSIRLYLPLIGLSGILLIFLNGAARRIHIPPKPLIIAVMILYAVISVLQNHRYGDPHLIWRDVVDAYPKSGMARGAFASIYAATGDYSSAAKEYAVAHQLEPLRPGYRIDEWRMRLKSGGSLKEIAAEVDREPLDSIDIGAKTKLALLVESLGDKKRAENLLLEVVNENPSYGLAHLRLAQFSERMGDVHRARLAYHNALQLMPNHPAARDGAKRFP